MWQAEMNSAIKSSKQLRDYIHKNSNQKIKINNFDDAEYPIFIPIRYLDNIIASGKNSPLWNQFIPNIDELESPAQIVGLYDPIGDQAHAKDNGIIHRYENRLLFTPTVNCPINCRYCFRKNELAANDDIFQINLKKVRNYLNEHTEVNEIIFSGGDPLILSNSKIETYLLEFSKIKHIKFIRFHTRTPLIIPSRIDDEFIKLIQKYSSKFISINMVIHANHTDEFNKDVRNSLAKLTKANIQLLCQSVLLKNVNNSVDDLKNLIFTLMNLNIRPYYLHHPDQVYGAMHFYLSLEQGRKLFAELRNVVPGWALPQYMLDPPNGHGKISAFNPEAIDFSGKLIDRSGQQYRVESTL